MDSKRLLHTVEWLVAIAAYVYLAYRLATYPRYDELAAELRSMDSARWMALTLSVLLMPLNMFLEAWRWRTMMGTGGAGVPMTYAQAQRQVYYSKLAGLLTPWHLGEYPARALLADSPPAKVLSMGAVGSAMMTAAIVFAGVIALLFSPSITGILGGSYLYAMAALCLVLMILLYLAPGWLRKWVHVSKDLLLRTFLQSLVRLACWCLQLALVLYALKAIQTTSLTMPDAWLKLPVYYLLVTVSPNVPVAEAGVRGAWAMFLFGSVNAALAGVLLWIINTLLPCLCWPFLRKSA